MENSIITQLYQYASEYNLVALHTLSEEILPCDDMDVHLILAQVKLLAADETIQQDLARADEIDTPSAFPCLDTVWAPQNADSFAVFDKREGALKRFVDALPDACRILGKWYGNVGEGMVRQTLSEILYFSGEFEKSATLANEQYCCAGDDYISAIMSAYVLLRCYLAQSEVELAEESLLNIIRLARENADNPTFSKIYQTIRNWANITTGWSGDTRRYHILPDGNVLPVLEDRTDAIQKGISKLQPAEEQILSYASLRYQDVCTMRGFFMHVFNAMYYFRAGQLEQTDHYFDQAYHISKNSGLVMPFAEYGRQIIPLLNHIAKTHTHYSRQWVDTVSTLAEKYEQGINAFRG